VTCSSHDRSRTIVGAEPHRPGHDRELPAVGPRQLPRFARTRASTCPPERHSHRHRRDRRLAGDSASRARLAARPIAEGIDLPMVITVQTQGFENFRRASARVLRTSGFDERRSRAPGGASRYGATHDTGYWEVVGP